MPHICNKVEDGKLKIKISKPRKENFTQVLTVFPFIAMFKDYLGMVHMY